MFVRVWPAWNHIEVAGCVWQYATPVPVRITIPVMYRHSSCVSTGSATSPTYLSRAQGGGGGLEVDTSEEQEAAKSRRRDSVMVAVRAHFRPEFVNRIDEFAIFDPLSKDQIKEIVRMQVRRVAKRLEAQRIGLITSEAAINYLVERGYDPVYGARPVKRAVQRELETPLARSILQGEFEADDVVSVDDGEQSLRFSKGR